jgi:Mg2+-importing ATPase
MQTTNAAAASGAPTETLYHTVLQNVLAELKTSDTGLTTREAQARADEIAAHQPVQTSYQPAVAAISALFLNPLILILLIASGISAAVGDPVSAAIIIVIVLLGAAINFIQTYRSQRAMEKLREKVAPTATVLRDGNWSDVLREQVVPGDVIRLNGGDLVPADARLLQARDLHVQQAALTGESLPVEKRARVGGGLQEDSAADDIVFLGTSVVSGSRYGSGHYNRKQYPLRRCRGAAQTAAA